MLTVLRLFDNPFSKYFFLKEFLACNGCYGLFIKIRSGSRTTLWCTYSAWFFLKNVPYLILYQLIKFQCHSYLFFPSQDIKQNVLSSYLDKWWFWKLYNQLWSSSKAMVNRKREGKTETQNFEYLKNEKSFLDEIKSIFYNCLRVIILWKNENSRHKL